jgi:hypothetical protein
MTSGAGRWRKAPALHRAPHRFPSAASGKASPPGPAQKQQRYSASAGSGAVQPSPGMPLHSWAFALPSSGVSGRRIIGRDQAAGIGDPLRRARAQHAQEIQPPVIGGQSHPQAAIRALHDFAHQHPAGKTPPSSGADHAVAGAQISSGVSRNSSTGMGRCRRSALLAGRRAARPPARAVRIGQQDHPRRALTDAGDATREPQPVHHRPAVHDPVARARR